MHTKQSRPHKKDQSNFKDVLETRIQRSTTPSKAHKRTGKKVLKKAASREFGRAGGVEVMVQGCRGASEGRTNVAEVYVYVCLFLLSSGFRKGWG